MFKINDGSHFDTVFEAVKNRSRQKNMATTLFDHFNPFKNIAVLGKKPVETTGSEHVNVEKAWN